MHGVHVEHAQFFDFELSTRYLFRMRIALVYSLPLRMCIALVYSLHTYLVKYNPV